MTISKSKFNPNCNRDLLKCKLCDMNEVGDEFHYMFKCSAFGTERTKYLGKEKKMQYEYVQNTKHDECRE